MSIFKVFIFPRVLVSLLAVSNATNSAELVGNFVFWDWRRMSRGA
jgi:hypothetical protein